MSEDVKRLEAFEVLFEVKRVVDVVKAFVKSKCQLSNGIIEDLNSLGDLGKKIELYAIMTHDDSFIKEVAKLHRDALYQVNGWYEIESNTRLSIAYCLNSICNIVNIGNEQQSQQANDEQPQQANDEKTTLPQELDAERTKKYFDKAIKVGYMMKKTKDCYQWTFGGNKGQVRLGYFCSKIFDNPRPINALESLFNVKKLSSSITAASIPATRTDVKKWRKEIDDKIFTD